MTTKYIKFCPVCGGTNLDVVSYGSDGHAQCKDCNTRFTVDSVSLKHPGLVARDDDRPASE